MTTTNTTTERGSGRAAAWLVLIGMGATQVIFNVFHATHYGHMLIALALLYGVMPPAAAAGLSHIVAVFRWGWFMKAVTFLVMIGGMVMSTSATATVVGPTAGKTVFAWLFGLVMDAAALIALTAILTPAGPARAIAPAAALDRVVAEPSSEPRTEPTGGPSTEPIGGPETGPSGEPIGEPKGEPNSEPIGAPETGPDGEPQSRTGVAQEDPDADAARRAYRASVRAGRPLSDRKLGEMYGQTRRWGQNRITECKARPKLTAAR